MVLRSSIVNTLNLHNTRTLMRSGYIFDNINQIDNSIIKTKTTTTKIYRRLHHYNYRHTATRYQRTPYRNLPWAWGMKNRRLIWNWITIPIKINRQSFSNKAWIIIRPNKPNVKSRMVKPEVKSKESVDSNLVFIKQQRDSIGKTRITTLNYGKLYRDVL